MPDFENIDQYETVNPRSGKARIVPIAPHSMQAVNYRPQQRKEASKPIPKPESEFKSVEIEPVSIKQMEKEFRQASRSQARRHPKRGFSGWLKRLRKFLLSVLKPAKKKARRGPGQKSHSRNPRPDRSRKSRGRDPREKSKGEGASQESKGPHRSRRRRGPRSNKTPRADSRRTSPGENTTEKNAKSSPKTPKSQNRSRGGSAEGNSASEAQASSRKPRSSRSGRSRRNRRPNGNASGRQDSRGPQDSGPANSSGSSE